MNRRSTIRRCLAAVVIVGSTATGARADTTSSCSDAALEAQSLRDARQLLESQALLRRCAARECPAIIQKDCARWLEDVQKSLPTVVLTAKSASGELLVDVKVTVDGVPFASQLDGRSAALNPGIHTFVFERSDGVRTEKRVPVREGERNQEVVAVFETETRTQAASHGEPTATANAVPEPSPSPWRTVGWVAGGLGVLGIGLGATFGLIAASDKSEARCDEAGYCASEAALDSARKNATIANIGFIAGGTLLAGGAALVLLAPRGASTRTTPRVAIAVNGIVVGGAW